MAGAGNLADFERRVIERAVEQELKLVEALTRATSGLPVNHVQRPQKATDDLIRAGDAALVDRMVAMGPFLSRQERAKINERFSRLGQAVPFPAEQSDGLPAASEPRY